ncbi:MAG: GDP-mannose 4,6-dehydratase [Nitrosospira sp.]|nr:GDP-mannose 4,6-dehydratase [Nitrosospira sp.]
MRILVTGADGFTGRHFAVEAASSGHDVIALKANLNDIASLNQEVLSIAPDAVLHLAAISFVGHGNDEEFYRVNVIGTMNLLNALVQPGLKKARVLVASSANVYGTPDVELIDESVSPAPINHYAASKLAMEFMVKTFFNKLPIIITRPFNYTGVGQHESFLIPKIVEHFRQRSPFIELGNLDVWREFSDVRAVAQAYRLLIEDSSVDLTVNVCTGHTHSLREVLTMTEEISGHKIEVRVNPAFMRENEVKSLRGDATRLRSLIGEWDSPLLKETLRWMLTAKA